MTNYVIASGCTSNGISLHKGDTMLVSSGGSATDITVNGGSLELRGGAVIRQNVFGSSGGTITLDSGFRWNANGNPASGIVPNGVMVVNRGAMVESACISSGGEVVLYGDTHSVILDGGKLLLNGPSAWLTGYKTTFRNPKGTLAAASGGSIYNLVVQSGFNIVASNGGYVSGFTLSGGTLEIQSGAHVGGNTISGGGTLYLDSGVTWNAGGSSVSGATSGGTIVVSSGATLMNTPVLAGGSALIGSGGQIGGTTDVSSGGTLVLNGTAGTGVVNLAGDGSQLTISGTSMPTNVISGWSSTDRIDFASIPKSSITGVTTSGDTLTLKTTRGNYQLNVPGVSRYGYQLVDNGNGDTVYTTCFAEGTMIATPDGEIAVEDITAGTLVNTPKGAMPVKWLGHRSIDVHAMREPEENWLVRIRKGAIAENVPASDLLITQEHCMVFDGKLVPARMLVNGVSIVIDRSISSYTYYHVELESHEAIWADGALTESYLDTGNRDQFSNSGVTTMFPPRHAAAGGSESLPLDTSRAFVERLHAAIAARAASAIVPVATINDPDLHLVTDQGHVIFPARQTNDRFVFMIPASAREVRIVSRIGRPSDTIGPFVDDRRHLGVLVGEVFLFEAHGTRALTRHLTDPSLKGWHALENGVCRWTIGNAILPIDTRALYDGQGVLAVQIVAAGPYLAQNAELRRAG